MPLHGYKVGFSGTRKGMTQEQRATFRSLIQLLQPKEFHHGDCIGADCQADEMIHLYVPECEVIIHPPKSDKYRAYCPEGVLRDEKPYLDRNRDIVNETGLVIIVPETDTVPDPVKGGTWYTYSHAWKEGRIIIAISVAGLIRLGHNGQKGPM